MSECHPSATPVDTHAKLSASDGDLLPDGTEYQSLAGGLQYITLTCPDISYAVQQICLHMHAPRTSNLALVKRVLRYVCGTMDFGLHLRASSSISLMAYSDADWAGCSDSRRSTSGYCVYYGDRPPSRAPVLKPSTEPSPMQWLSAAGFVSFFRSSIILSPRLHLSTATTSPPSTCRPIQCNIAAPSTLRSTATSFASASPSAKFLSYTSPPLFSLLM
jgi:hypothetical protein